jgi:pimeloyl-ACP methyl ester carboxylesterase
VSQPVEEHVVRTDRHTTFYLASGPVDGTPIIFVHGWPELSISWRHQLPCLAMLGFRAIAPDMRGYGRSSVYPRHEDYAMQHGVQDMLELLDGLGHQRAVWVGHDWGADLVWRIASHHPERCYGVANLCVPYVRQGFAPANLVRLVDRATYPESEFPVGQWDYMLFYEERFDDARRALEAKVGNTIKLLFRMGSPEGRGKPARTASLRKNGGWYGPGGRAAPDVPMDTNVLSIEAWRKYSAALERTGFAGPNAWYMNHARNIEYARQAQHGGKIGVPALFLHAEYDYVCETTRSRLAEPMRADCGDLTEAVVQSGHWMAQEQPLVVNAELVRWLARRFPELWRAGAEPSDGPAPSD